MKSMSDREMDTMNLGTTVESWRDDTIAVQLGWCAIDHEMTRQCLDDLGGGEFEELARARYVEVIGLEREEKAVVLSGHSWWLCIDHQKTLANLSETCNCELAIPNYAKVLQYEVQVAAVAGGSYDFNYPQLWAREMDSWVEKVIMMMPSLVEAPLRHELESVLTRAIAPNYYISIVHAAMRSIG